MGTAAERLTVEDYYALTTEGDHTQLVDGRIVVHDPKPAHEAVRMFLLGELHVWTRNGPGRGLLLPGTNVHFGEHNVLCPDGVWIAEEHRPDDMTRYPDRVPDLCVEVRSPGTWRYDIGAKKRAYQEGGLPELWLVDDRARSVLVFRRSKPDAPAFDVALELAEGDVLTSPQLPGFALPLEDLFRP